jgi:hypothetical protein
VALKVDPRHGSSTGRVALLTRRPGSNVLLLLDLLEDPPLGSSDLEVEVEATAATANTAAEEGEIAALRHGNNPEVATTAMAVTEVDTVVDTEAEAMEMEVKVRLPEAQLLGSNRMLATVLRAWIATAPHHHHHRRRLVESRHHRLPATSRRLLHLHHSSGLRIEPLEEFVDSVRVLASGVLNQ